MGGKTLATPMSLQESLGTRLLVPQAEAEHKRGTCLLVYWGTSVECAEGASQIIWISKQVWRLNDDPASPKTGRELCSVGSMRPIPEMKLQRSPITNIQVGFL